MKVSSISILEINSQQKVKSIFSISTHKKKCRGFNKNYSKEMLNVQTKLREIYRKK